MAYIVKKDIAKVKLIASGAGTYIDCVFKFIGQLGLPRENIIVCDSKSDFP